MLLRLGLTVTTADGTNRKRRKLGFCPLHRGQALLASVERERHLERAAGAVGVRLSRQQLTEQHPRVPLKQDLVASVDDVDRLARGRDRLLVAAVVVEEACLPEAPE